MTKEAMFSEGMDMQRCQQVIQLICWP